MAQLQMLGLATHAVSRVSRRCCERQHRLHHRIGLDPQCDIGLFPQVRGLHAVLVDHPDLQPIIPAYAGHTFWHDFLTLVSPDNPRVCGAWNAIQFL